MVKKTTTHLQARALKLEEKVEDVATENFEENEVSIGRACPQEKEKKKEEKESERARDAEG